MIRNSSKKNISESKTVNNMKLMILEKIRVLHTCSSSPHAACLLVANDVFEIHTKRRAQTAQPCHDKDNNNKNNKDNKKGLFRPFWMDT